MDKLIEVSPEGRTVDGVELSLHCVVEFDGSTVNIYKSVGSSDPPHIGLPYYKVVIKATGEWVGGDEVMAILEAVIQENRL